MKEDRQKVFTLARECDILRRVDLAIKNNNPVRDCAELRNESLEGDSLKCCMDRPVQERGL